MAQTESKLAAISRHLLRPMRGGAGFVVAVFAILLATCTRSLFGLPLELLLLSWFAKYAFILFDNTVRGFDEPPALDISMMNPYGEIRPTVALLIVSGMAALTWTAYERVGPAAAYVIGVLFALAAPSSIAVLGLESNALQAVNPIAWMQIIHGLGAYYWLTLGLVAAEFALLYLLGHLPLGLVLQYASGMFGTLSAFSLLAGALYERRDPLGLVTWVSPERIAEKQRQEDHRQDEKVITEAYGLMRTMRHQDSWRMLQSWLEAQGFSPEAYRWLTEQTDRWEDPRYAMRLAQDWVERLLTQKQVGQGLSVVVSRLQRDPAFRPKTAADTLSLAQLAARGGASPRTARTLLSDFAQRFPDDPRTKIASELTQHLS
jgi:hypothetical protein